MMDQRLKEDLLLVKSKRVYFGHQSVGSDIVNGIKDLDSPLGATDWNAITLNDSMVPQGPFLAHSFVGRNGDPESKCDEFSKNVERLLADSVDIAVLKFCYADIRHDRDIDQLSAYYQSTMDQLKRRFPQVTFMHVTVPVTSRTSWWKRQLRLVLGKDDEWDIGSIKRNEFNKKLVERYKGEPIFDLAAVESTHPDGTREEFEYRGRSAYSLVDEYTYDGGHLNETGRRSVAKEFIHVLADIIRRDSK